jgi:hypothetical protein
MLRPTNEQGMGSLWNTSPHPPSRFTMLRPTNEQGMGSLWNTSAHPPSRFTMRHFIGSLWIARCSACLATVSFG